MATEMPAAMRPYSMAVAPDSHLAKVATDDNTDVSLFAAVVQAVRAAQQWLFKEARAAPVSNRALCRALQSVPRA